MWRNSLGLSPKLGTSANRTVLNPTQSLLLLRVPEIEHGLGSLARSTSSSAADSGNQGFQSSDSVRAFGSVSATHYVESPSPPLWAASSVSSVRELVKLVRNYGHCYWELAKARLSMLVVATSGAGYVLGSASAIDFARLGFTCAGTMMVAAAANSLNQIFEVNNDAKMKRTRRRPLPSGRITVHHAAIWASSVGIAGTALLASKANMLAAVLGASNLFLYACVYTPLKQIHPVNTWVGAVVGAVPPLLGWVAASGQISLNGMILPAALYFWQIPHFMALAYLCRDDYAAGGFRMFSLSDPSGRRTALVALRNCIYLLPLGYLAYDWGMTSGWFCLESTLLTLAVAGTALTFYSNRTTQGARRMFHASLLYLPVFMTGLMFHRVSNDQQLPITAEHSNFVNKLSSKLETSDRDYETSDRKKNANYALTGSRARPPVAYASVAPFPFLPVPVYAN